MGVGPIKDKVKPVPLFEPSNVQVGLSYVHIAVFPETWSGYMLLASLEPKDMHVSEKILPQRR